MDDIQFYDLSLFPPLASRNTAALQLLSVEDRWPLLVALLKSSRYSFFFKMALIWFTGNIHESFAPKKAKLIIASFQLTCQQQAASSYFTLYIFQTSQFCLSPQPAVYCRAQIFSALTSFLEVPLLTQDG